MNKKIIALNWSWGIIMNLVGLIASLICLATGKFEMKKCPNSPLIAIVLKSDYNMGSATLGMFCITGKYNYEHGMVDDSIDFTVMDHEWGHTIQNAIAGPGMIVIALCSLIWCTIIYTSKRKKDPSLSYYSYWTESWANDLGLKYKNKTLDIEAEKEKFEETKK